jgi:hypothetical protein
VKRKYHHSKWLGERVRERERESERKGESGASNNKQTLNHLTRGGIGEKDNDVDCSNS